MSNLKILPKDWPEEQKIDPPSNFSKKGKITDEMEEEIDEDRRYSIFDDNICQLYLNSLYLYNFYAENLTQFFFICMQLDL